MFDDVQIRKKIRPWREDLHTVFLFLLWQNRVFSNSISNRIKTSQLGK